MLTSRERLLRLFAGQELDRVPIWLLFPWHPLGCYVDVWHQEAYRPVIERIERGDVDSFDRRSAGRGFCYNANPDIRYELIQNAERQGTAVCAPGLRLEKYVERSAAGTHVKYYVDDPQTLRKILDIPYIPPQPDARKLREERAEFGARGLFMLDLGDPLGPLYNLMSAGDFAMATATDYDLLEEFLDEMLRRVLNLYRACLEQDLADCYFIVGCEFAGPPLVSPKRFMEMSARYVKQLCALIREYGKISIVHYHGNLYQVLSGMRDMDFDGLHTIEAPPVGDCTIAQARAALGKGKALIGNLQYDDLVRKSGDEIEAMVQSALTEAAGGQFILSPTAGPYEEHVAPRCIENYLRMIDAAHRYGPWA